MVVLPPWTSSGWHTVSIDPHANNSHGAYLRGNRLPARSHVTASMSETFLEWKMYIVEHPPRRRMLCFQGISDKFVSRLVWRRALARHSRKRPVSRALLT